MQTNYTDSQTRWQRKYILSKGKQALCIGYTESQ